jgi:hypothetical protein
MVVVDWLGSAKDGCHPRFLDIGAEVDKDGPGDCLLRFGS